MHPLAFYGGRLLHRVPPLWQQSLPGAEVHIGVRQVHTACRGSDLTRIVDAQKHHRLLCTTVYALPRILVNYAHAIGEMGCCLAPILRAREFCDGLSAPPIDRLLRRWLARLPHPFTPQDRDV